MGVIDQIVQQYGDNPFPCTFIHEHNRERVVTFDKPRAVTWLSEGGKVNGGADMVELLSDRLLFEELLENVVDWGFEFLPADCRSIKLR